MDGFGAMKRICAFAAGIVFALSVRAVAQTTTTNTNCNLNGNTANCTSTTTDNSAQQRQSYEAGQQIGNALGVGLARVMQSHSQTKWVKKFCAANPGQSWHWTQNGEITARGKCPTANEKSAQASNAFMAKHKDYIPEQKNVDTINAYLEAHNLNPTEEKSYEMAYKDLKKDHQLHLYSN